MSVLEPFPVANFLDISGTPADDVSMRYPGGKGKCFQHIINLLPQHTTYIETHLGGGAVLRHKAPASESIGVDIDRRVIEWWQSNHPKIATFVVGDALNFLRTYQYTGSEVIYCDPPYLPSTRKRSRVYKHDLTQEDHLALLEVLKALPCRVLISGYPSALYKRELQGWNELRFSAKAHDGVRLECLWANYKVPDRLHDARFLGANFRERQDAKRRNQRLRNRISSLSKPEQHHLAAWLLEELTAEGGSYCSASRT